MTLIASTEADIPQITAWMLADIDPCHRVLGADFWLSSQLCVGAGKIMDDGGDAAYYRVDREGDEGYRLHIQFAPEDVVSKRRVVVTGVEFMRFMTYMAESEKKKFIVTESVSPKLIRFMKKIGFTEHEGNDYILQISEE